MIPVTVTILGDRYDYHIELHCLPSNGDPFMFYIDEDDPDYTYTIVDKVEHYHSSDSGHEIWITLSRTEADK